MAEIQIRVRRDTTTNWTTNDPTLALGEVGFDTDLRRYKVGDGASAWSVLDFLPQPYDLLLGFEGAPTASKLDWRLIGRAATILTADPGNGYARTAATALTTFDIQKNGVSVGSVEFAAAAQVGTITLAADVAMGAGDRIELIAPAAPDSTLADIQLHLKALDR